MIIEGPDFKLIPVKDSDKFDLEMIKVVNKGKANERTEFDVVGYGYALDRAVRIIIMQRLSQKENVLDLQEFLKAYRNELTTLQEQYKLN